ncbi:hypothetical protein C8R48DRAFT_778399 [Suillus tomentosus]|nr:hypothetical protein C8R48DRAFT_778399 [Suillus tomentosus]
MAPKKWATLEQEAVLESLLAEYRICTTSKNYTQFWPKINRKFFAEWPVYKEFFPNVEDEDQLTEEQLEVIRKPLEQQKFQIKCWYRWQTNPMCLARSGGSRGVLSIEETLAGGTHARVPRAPKEVEVYSQMYYADNVKHSADEAIAKGNITSHGSKLRVRREITAEKYEGESSTVKDKVKKKHKKLCKKFRKAHRLAKAKVKEDVDDKTKLRCTVIHELPNMLDRIFRHLSHMTGGWKFSILMGGRDPETGGNCDSSSAYHLGESATAGQFSDSYDGYSEVLKAYASFVENTIKYEEKLPAIEQDNASNLDGDEGDQSEDDSSDNDSSSEAAEGDEVQHLESVAGVKEVARMVGDDFGTDSWENWTFDEFSASQPQQKSHNVIDYDRLERVDYDAALALLETSLTNLGTRDSNIETSNLHLPTLPPVGCEVPIPPFVLPVSAPSHPRVSTSHTPCTCPASTCITGHPASQPPTPPALVLPVRTSPVIPVSQPPTPPALVLPVRASPVIPVSQPPTPPALVLPVRTSSVIPASQPPTLAATSTPQPAPTPHLEDNIPVRCTGRARPSVPFNRRELDNDIGGNSQRGSKRQGEDIVRRSKKSKVTSS